MPQKDIIQQWVEEARALLGEEPGREISGQLHALARNAMSRLDVVSRDEFDAQCAVLARTRARVEALERELAELTRRLDDSNPPGR